MAMRHHMRAEFDYRGPDHDYPAAKAATPIAAANTPLPITARFSTQSV
jgi:hypothetical protein